MLETKADTRQNKKLTNLQVFKFFAWLQETVPSCQEGVNQQDLANRATEVLGFEINKNHVDGALEQLNLRLPKPPASSEVKLGILKRAVEALYKSLGQELPPEWTDL